MKKLTVLLLGVLLHAATMFAVPAKPGSYKAQQPDGSTVTIRLHGDEYLHFNTTTDGYSVVNDHRGYYVYAALSGGQLIPTNHVAHDAESRSASEKAYLDGVNKYLVPQMSSRVSDERLAEAERQAQARARQKAPGYDFTKMRGLIILVEYNDKEFQRDDYLEIMEQMVNSENYTGYADKDGKWVECTGSVHDYYRDNSNGMFQPKFDLVGPVMVNRSQYYPEKDGKNSMQLMRDVINAADDIVDFSLYDGDKDGIVDMIYFLFAGCGSNITGNDERLLWPHATQLFQYSAFGQPQYINKDGVRLGRCACSTELDGSEKSPYMDGIGTICHEFTHVLGLADFYDTNYEEDGQTDDPAEFDIMAGGSYLNYGRTPCGYTLYERYAMGFATPQTIDGEGSFSMESLELSNTGYRINTPVSKEYFLLENRQRTKWDRYIPATGMCVFRIDSTNVNAWRNNQVNTNPKHMYYQLLRAGGTVSTTTFPGLARVRELSRVTSPANLLTWSGAETRLGLKNIQESDGVITFDVFDTFVLQELSLPEAFAVGEGLQRVLTATATPSYSKFKLTWASDNASVATVDQTGRITGVSAGTATITVTSDNGLVASCVVTVEPLTIAESISAFRQMDDGAVAALPFQGAQVLYAYKKDIYVRDGSGAMILRNTGLSVAKDDVLEGFVYGKRVNDNGMPVLENVAGKSSVADVTVTASSTPVEPRPVTLKELTEADYCDLVLVKATHWVSDGGIWAVSGDHRARLFNAFQIKNITVPTDYAGKYFDVTAIFGTNTAKNVGVINELKLLESPVEVDAPSAIMAVGNDVPQSAQPGYNLSGQRVNDTYRGLVIKGGHKVMVK
ncbi:MAG: M6 family metalloprotease domain-containing protein [Prevotella sp.]|nr:M6 family metalloprotease domain-containing protein [Prevotella sp.]